MYHVLPTEVSPVPTLNVNTAHPRIFENGSVVQPSHNMQTLFDIMGQD